MIIAFTAGMGAGKSTAVELLRSMFSGEHNFKPVLNVKFAAPIYDIQEYIYSRISTVYKRPSTFIKDRKLLQWVGTEFGRSLSETLWVDLWKARAQEIRNSHPRSIVVCDDVRFDNEADAVHSLGGFVVKINCGKNKERIDTADGLKHHASESGINPKLVDYEVANDGTLDEFKLAIRNLCGLIDHRTTHKL